LFQPLQVLAVERLRGAKVHGDAVLDNLILIENLIQHLERLTAIDHVVF
jgi:hypothetical protein